MTRHIGQFAAGACVALALAACDRPTGVTESQDKSGVTEHQKEVQANEQIANAQAQAEEQAEKARVSAEREIAKARADFEKTRDDYLRDKRMDLANLDEQIGNLRAESKTAKGNDRVRLQRDLPKIEAKRNAFSRQLETLSSASSTTWDTAKSKVEKEWDELKAAVDQDNGKTTGNSNSPAKTLPTAGAPGGPDWVPQQP